MIKREDIEKLSALARLPVSEEEAKELSGDIERILEYVGEVGKVSPPERTPQIGDVYNRMRDDGDPHESSQFTKRLLEAAPVRDGEYVKVKRILG